MKASFRSVDDAMVTETGALDIAGNFFHQQNAMLQLQVGGVNKSNPQEIEHDEVLVDGFAILEGDLTVEFLPEFAPVNGTVITLLQASAISGDFSSINVAGLPAGFEAIVVTAFDEVLLAISGQDFLLGDVNQDGVVNLLDVQPFIELLNSSTFQEEADTNGDGVVNLLDIEPFIDLISG